MSVASSRPLHGVGRVLVQVSAVVLAGTVAASSMAFADAPADALRASVVKTAGARTARIAITQHTTVGSRASDASASGVLVGGDNDLVVSGEIGPAHRVAVGTRVKERRPGQPWRESSRPAPTQTSALGPLTLADGSSLGDAKLYRTITDAGTETVNGAVTRKIVGDLDMAALATAMQVSGADATRMQQWSGSLTFWVGGDGTVARNALHLVLAGGTTIDAQVDLSDLDTPLTVTLP